MRQVHLSQIIATAIKMCDKKIGGGAGDNRSKKMIGGWWVVAKGQKVTTSGNMMKEDDRLYHDSDKWSRRQQNIKK